MKDFKLYTGSLLQGTFNLQAVNIAFVFQVNCPGCFIYGFPAMNNLYQKFKEEIGFIGISTAFEDFEYNNGKNTKLLLSKGITVGETKKYLLTQELDTYSQLPLFPIAFDKMSATKDFLTDKNILELISMLTQSATVSETEKQNLELRIRAHYARHPFIAETFTLNQLRGTPSFIIFKENLEVIHASFGHQSEQVLSELLQNNLLPISTSSSKD